jgi:hypothetical protein
VLRSGGTREGVNLYYRDVNVECEEIEEDELDEDDDDDDDPFEDDEFDEEDSSSDDDTSDYEEPSSKKRGKAMPKGSSPHKKGKYSEVCWS